jgi:hypothetical protein
MSSTSEPSSLLERPLCFVIGPIGKEGTDIRRHADLLLHAVFKHVAESVQFNYRVKRADEDADPGMIGDRVVADILHADLVIADLTDLNANAFYELGIRHATGKPAIHVARAGTALPFDNISHRTIFIDLSDWHSIESGRKRLSDAILAIKRPGFQVSNPITQANASFRMRESADSRDQVVVQLRDRLNQIESILSNRSESRNPRRDPVRALGPTGDGYVYISTSPLFGKKGKPIKMRPNFSSFGDFLDGLFFKLNEQNGEILPFMYDEQWILEDDLGNKFNTTRSESSTDDRTLNEVGIYPGTLLRVAPARP